MLTTTHTTIKMKNVVDVVIRLLGLFERLAAAAAAVAVVAVVVSAVTAATVLATTTAAVVMLGLKLLGGGVAHELHVARIAHRLAGKLVVEVHGDLVVGDLGDDALDAHAVLGHHGDTSAHADVLVVKLAVNVEDFLLEFVNHVGVLGAEGLLGLQREVKFLALLEVKDVVLESLDQRDVHAEHKRVGMFLIELENTHLLVAVDNKNLIHEFDVFTCLNFLH